MFFHTGGVRCFFNLLWIIVQLFPGPWKVDKRNTIDVFLHFSFGFSRFCVASWFWIWFTLVGFFYMGGVGRSLLVCFPEAFITSVHASRPLESSQISHCRLIFVLDFGASFLWAVLVVLIF